MNRVTIIAEAGVNHNGDMILAKRLIEMAAEAGADYVKFQTFVTELNISKQARKADYQIANTGNEESQYAMIKRLELSFDDFSELAVYAEQRGIKFLSTAFDQPSIDFLSGLSLDYFKIPSGEITNLPYLKSIGSLKRKVILSTGMCNMGEINDAINILVEAGTMRENITVLHCTSDYPTPMSDVNLRAMVHIGETLKLPIGYSDHTEGIEVPIAATALGACVIEKHFTLDKNLPGPDHKASLDPSELKEMVRCIRNIEKALGSHEKQPTAAEEKNRLLGRKSIHLARELKANEILREEDLVMKRPGDGISAMLLRDIIGKCIATNLPAEHKLSWEDIIS